MGRKHEDYQTTSKKPGREKISKRFDIKVIPGIMDVKASTEKNSRNRHQSTYRSDTNSAVGCIRTQTRIKYALNFSPTREVGRFVLARSNAFDEALVNGRCPRAGFFFSERAMDIPSCTEHQ